MNNNDFFGKNFSFGKAMGANVNMENAKWKPTSTPSILQSKNGLPNGWTAYKDAMGDIWYQQNSTGKSQWDRPNLNSFVGINNTANVNMGNDNTNWFSENGESVNVNMTSHVNKNSGKLRFRNNANVRMFNVPDGSFKYHQGLKSSTAKNFLSQPNVYKKSFSNTISNYQKHLNAKHNANPNLNYKILNQNIVETVGAIAANHESLPNMLGNNRVRTGINNLNRPGNSNNTRRRKSNARNRKTKIATRLREYYSNF